MPPRQAIAHAVTIIGGQVATADALGCSQAIVSLWVSGGRKPSAAKTKELERLTGGQIKREWIRPDIFG